MQQRKEDEVPALHRMVTGLTFLPAKSKRPFFLPLSWNEIQSEKNTETNKTGVKEESDKKKQRVVTYEEKRLLVKEFLESQNEKLCFNAQEACKVLFSMFPTADRRIPQQFVDPKVGGWLFDPELQSYDFESLLSYFVVRDAADPTARRKKVVAQGELALVSDSLDQEAAPLSKGNNSASSSPASSSSGDNNLQLLFKDMLQCFVLLANLKLRLKNAQLWDILMAQEMPVACICAKMELQGIGFDSKGISKYQQQLRERMKQLEKDVVQVLGHGLLLSSPKQVSHALFNELKLTVPASHKRKRSESPTQSTSEDVLVKLKDQHPLPGIVLEFRHLQKLIGTYIVSFGRKAVPDPNDSQLSRIYATWQTVNTATGRLSCTDPNLQALPREGISIPVSKGATMQSSVYINVRDAFCSSAGYVFLKADYSQMEMRILAYMSRDEQLMRFFAEGKDIHRLIAGQMFGKPAEEVDPSEREKAKCIVYGILYGMGPHSLAAILKTDPKEAKNFTNTFLEKFPSVAQFFEQVIEKARAEGSVRTLFNRRRLFPNIESANFESANKSERQAVNTMIQGTAADIVKRAMIAVEEALEDKEQTEARSSSTAERTSIANLVLNIHDELVYEVREDMMDWMRQTVTRCMERITVKADELMDVPIPIRLYEGKRFGSLSPSPSVQAAQSS
ncbi:DNA polymerase I, variant 2 [Balamuthia mandrillaris]